MEAAWAGASWGQPADGVGQQSGVAGGVLCASACCVCAVLCGVRGCLPSVPDRALGKPEFAECPRSGTRQKFF